MVHQMEKITHAGISTRKKVRYIPIDQLHLDSLNPRLPEEVQGKKEAEVLEVMYRVFDLEELAFSMAENGYFDEEPVVVVPKVDSKGKPMEDYFIVVEGNRRVATIKILLSLENRKKFGIRSWPILEQEITDDLSIIPAIEYSDRNSVLPYLGVRHIAGIKKWNAYPKARYVASMVATGYTLDQVQQQIGDRQNSARKHYMCYRLIEQAKNEFDFDFNPERHDFSYLMLATGQGSVKRFIGLPTQIKEVNFNEPVPTEKVANLKDLLSWLYGEDKKKDSVLSESRDITNLLSDVLASEDATEYLKRTRDLPSAYELSDGEETMVLKKLASANKKLESVLGIAHRHRTPDVIAETKKCRDTLKRLFDVVMERE